jgi:hypothetical protein
MKLSPEMNEKLIKLIVEYGNSLTRIDGEKDQCKAIAHRAILELGLEGSAFVKLATAYHRDTVEKDRDALDDLLALFECAKGIEKIDSLVKNFTDSLKAHGATMTVDLIKP